MARLAAGTTLAVESRAPNILLRLLWFVLIGWWLGGIASAIAWLLCVTIIGLPLGLWLVNRLPSIITLRPQEQSWWVDEHGLLRQGKPQRPFLLRALYFLLIGIWLSGLWMAAAYVAVMSVVLIPLAFWMYGRIGAVTTLFRS